jgi:hypothetical protein
LTGGVVAKLLRTQAGIRALRDGLILPFSHPNVSQTAQTIERAFAGTQTPVRSFAPALAAQDDNTTTTAGSAPR